MFDEATRNDPRWRAPEGEGWEPVPDSDSTERLDALATVTFKKYEGPWRVAVPGALLAGRQYITRAADDPGPRVAFDVSYDIPTLNGIVIGDGVCIVQNGLTNQCFDMTGVNVHAVKVPPKGDWRNLPTRLSRGETPVGVPISAMEAMARVTDSGEFTADEIDIAFTGDLMAQMRKAWASDAADRLFSLRTMEQVRRFEVLAETDLPLSKDDLASGLIRDLVNEAMIDFSHVATLEQMKKIDRAIDTEG